MNKVLLSLGAALFLAFTYAACTAAQANEPGGPSGVGQAGSRLSQQWLTGSDGSKVPAGWHDSQLGTSCQWTTLSYDLWGCVPDDVFTIGTGIDGLSILNPVASSDSACSKNDLVSLGRYESCKKYGLVRVPRTPPSTSIPGCAPSSIDDYYVVTPAPAATPAYYYGVPEGGGACCSCNPVPASLDRSNLFTFHRLDSSNVGSLNIVTGTVAP